MERIIEKKIVPVAVVERLEDAEPLARALMDAGLDILEITFRTAAAADAIRAILKAFPDMLVGAGTLLTPEQVRIARDAGAKFGVAPGLYEPVIDEARKRGLPFLPGVMTPTEVERAIGMGFKLLKFFPADVAGGVTMLKALHGPYAHTGVRFVPLGGVNLNTLCDYLALPNVAAIGGSWIVKKDLILEGQWDRITALTREALDKAVAFD